MGRGGTATGRTGGGGGGDCCPLRGGAGGVGESTTPCEGVYLLVALVRVGSAGTLVTLVDELRVDSSKARLSSEARRARAARETSRERPRSIGCRARE